MSSNDNQNDININTSNNNNTNINSNTNNTSSNNQNKSPQTTSSTAQNNNPFNVGPAAKKKRYDQPTSIAILYDPKEIQAAVEPTDDLLRWDNYADSFLNYFYKLKLDEKKIAVQCLLDFNWLGKLPKDYKWNDATLLCNTWVKGQKQIFGFRNNYRNKLLDKIKNKQQQDTLKKQFLAKKVIIKLDIPQLNTSNINSNINLGLDLSLKPTANAHPNKRTLTDMINTDITTTDIFNPSTQPPPSKKQKGLSFRGNLPQRSV